MRHFVVIAPSFIASQLVAPGSRVNEADLNGSKPGSALVEVDEAGTALKEEDRQRVSDALSGALPVAVAPIAPHAPNPTQPQALPAQPAGGIQLAGRDLPYVAAGGTDEPAASRVERLKLELAAAEAEAAASPPADGPLQPDPPIRREDEPEVLPPAEPGPLDQSIGDLTAHLDTVNDVEELQRLRAAETGGKSRKGALDAIDARLAELDA